MSYSSVSADPRVNVQVTVTDSHNTERTLKKFKRMCEAFGVTKEYRKRQAYKKPSVRRKEKFEAALKRKTKLERKMRSGRNSKI